VRKQLLGSSRGQAIAANVDVAIVVVALTDDSATRHVLHRTLNPRRIERYLVALSELHIRAVVAINKADLNSHAIHHRDTLRDDLGRADVLLVSAHSGVGLDELASRIASGETAVVVGSSGVGKSSVINRLLGSEIQSTYAVRNADARGRHTTVHRELFVLPSDGLIIDTPGMRQFALVGADGADADSQSHATGFEDFDDYAKLCRFRDCQHQGEPGCAVIAALETGELDAERLFHAQKLQRELARQRQRHDALAQRKARKARAALIQQMREVHERKGGGGRDE
jgi:ribosome biogenesis GTPase